MNTMTTMKMSYHARVERLDRLVACMTHIGYNEFAYEIPDPRSPDHIYTITDTGIILVRGADDGTVVTGYMATIKKLTAIFNGNVPTGLKKIVVRNEKKYAFLLRM